MGPGSTTFGLGAPARGDQLGDFNGDGWTDVIELHENGRACLDLQRHNPSYRIADFNCDGRDDLVGLNGEEPRTFDLRTARVSVPEKCGGSELGNDTFVFRDDFGHDIITDFDPQSSDIIQFDPAIFSDFNSVQSHSSNDGSGSTIITFDRTRR